MIAYCVCVYWDFIKKWITNGQHVKTKKPLKKRLAWVTAVNFRLTEKKLSTRPNKFSVDTCSAGQK